MELYAVAVLQREAERSGLASKTDSARKFAAYRAYLRKRGLSDRSLRSGKWGAYRQSCDRHLPGFFARLAESRLFQKKRLNFENVEVLSRIAGKKADLEISTQAGRPISVALKNYTDARRIQLHSATFNSFALGFFFDSDAVGRFVDRVSGTRFQGAAYAARDAALTLAGYRKVVPLMHANDEIQVGLRRRFVESKRFALSPPSLAVWREACAECGNSGVKVALKILKFVPPEQLKRRLLRMTGFDGTEEMLILDPVRFSDSITVPAFRRLRRALRARETEVTPRKWGQSIRFEFRGKDVPKFAVDVPFTINSNGAWVRGTPFRGRRHFGPPDNAELRWGERRPGKSRQLSTITLTWLDLRTTGIFVE